LRRQRFSFTESKTGLVQISFDGKAVTRLSGREASKFLNNVHGDSSHQQQLLMAKVTGNFKHGNERMSQEKG